MTVIFLLSSQSGLRVSQDAAVDKPIRTLAHLASYALLAGLLLWALRGSARRPTRRHVILALAVTTLYAISDELHQSRVADRVGRPEDVAIDVVGALIGLLVAVAILGWLEHAQGEPPRGDG
jgi:VanZ family protein